MGFGTTELIVILVIILIIFGVGKLPEVGAGLGKGIKEFKKAQKDVNEIAADATETKVEKADTTEEVKDENKTA
ncbi:MAG: twin-arginine translocase TatA/TatE family subunit [Deltaproteobacteria bacterium]|nr:twin-arginine translocase TatA/TatE family subunit [bacterium]MCB9487719.1 twin-arginine translocase TatA/TatE family subunit [Deltaproteobacteria bacterium]